MSKEQWSTRGHLPGRSPGNSDFYDVGYFAGAKRSLGIQFPEDGSYLDPNSQYQNKFKDTLRWIRERVPEGRILDVGSGPTHLTYWARKLKLPLSIISCDVSQPILSWAKEHNEATPVVSNGHQLPFTEDSFDGVLFADVLEHMWPQDAQRATQEALRILNPGGSIFINIPNRVTWNDAAKRDQGHVWLPTVHEMKELLETTGFDPESIHHYTRGFPMTNRVRKVTNRDLKAPMLGRSIFISAQKAHS